MASEGGSISLFSCTECKTRKVKCDRTKPTCNRCVKDHVACQYPTARKRPVQLPSRPRLHELENRLVELEDKLREKNANEQQHQFSPPDSGTPGSSTLVRTGRFEQLPPQWQIEELTNLYFAKVYADMPMIHPSRYIASLYQPPHMQPPMGLQYIIMALAAGASTLYKDLAEPFYRRARHYMENDEMKGDGDHVTVPHCQAWILIGHFEAQHLWFSKASMSTSRAVRLAQILNIHQLDGAGPINQTIPPPRTWSEKEERSRTFWTAFIMDRGASSTATWPVLIDVNKVKSNLPVSEKAYQNGVEEPSISLSEGLNHDMTKPRSPFACRVIAMHLLYECLDCNHSHPEVSGGFESTMFWNNLNQLDNSIALAFNALPAPMRCPDNAHESNAVVTCLQLHTATICLYRAASTRAQDEGVQPPLREEKAMPAAQQILTTIALAADINSRFRNPFVSFAAFMASFVFLQNFTVTQSEDSRLKMIALLDVMISVGMENPGFPATLAIQMARQLDRVGADPTAMHKVQPLMSKVDIEPPMMTDENTGAVVMCSMEGFLGPHPKDE